MGSSYENTTPPFTPILSPMAGSSPGAARVDPTNPLHSTFSHNKVQPPVPLPRHTVPQTGNSGGVRKVLESPRLQRKALTEAPSSPSATRLGQIPDHQARGSVVSGDPSRTDSVTVLLSSSSSSSSPRSSVGSSLQDSPSLDFSNHTSSRSLVPAESPKSPRRIIDSSNGTAVRERPPPSPSTSRRALTGTLHGVGLAARSHSGKGVSVSDSPRIHRQIATGDDASGTRGLRARSPSPVSGLQRDHTGGSGATLNGSIGGTQKSALTTRVEVSPVTSPHSHRKTTKESRSVQPRPRERKNSISEISDNEDELLEYHRWQREERMKEQEMERLVSVLHVLSIQLDECVYVCVCVCMSSGRDDTIGQLVFRQFVFTRSGQSWPNGGICSSSICCLTSLVKIR